jgi:hypothetical protein
MRKRSGKGSAAVVVAAAIALAGAPGAGAQGHPAPVPCTSIGGARYQCSFWPAGDGIHGGAPVQSSSGTRVGFLNSGSDWVVCQRVGGTVTQGTSANNWWAWTEANDHSWGWVSALYGHGGDNYGAFRGVPACPASQGFPPAGAATPAPTPPPPPTPPPGPTLSQRPTRSWTKPTARSSRTLVKSVATLFNQPCQLHDFGYRNFGTGLKLGPDENTLISLRSICPGARLRATPRAGARVI